MTCPRCEQPVDLETGNVTTAPDGRHWHPACREAFHAESRLPTVAAAPARRKRQPASNP